MPIEREYAIARSMSLTPTNNTQALERQAVSKFIEHLQTSVEANVVMELHGWFKDDVFARSQGSLTHHATFR